MAVNKTIEDTFEQLVYEANIYDFMTPKDFSVCYSFYINIKSGRLLTANQQNYIISLMKRYRNEATKHGVNYPANIIPLQWSNAPRIIKRDNRIWIEEEPSEYVYWVCMSFPYQLKEDFDLTIRAGYRAVWDAHRACWKLNLNDCNLLAVNEFAVKHKLEIDNSFDNEFAQYEEYNRNEDQIVPRCEIVDEQVVLINSNETADIYWKEHATGNISTDLFLAKTLGFKFVGLVSGEFKKIAASESTQFWVTTIYKFLKISYNVPGKVGVVLDRSSDTLNWLQVLVDVLELLEIDRTDVNINFRKTDYVLTKFIQDNDLMGTPESAKILIFLHKPPKWVFKDKHKFSILASNGLYPTSVSLTKNWFNSHPCVIYIGSIKPSSSKDKQIVKL